MLGADAVGRLALGQAPGGATTTILAAASGSVSLAGLAAIFHGQGAAALGSVALTGQPAVLTPALIGASGAFTQTGYAAIFQDDLAAQSGSDALYAPPVTGSETLVAGAGSFSVARPDATLGYDLLGGGGTITGGTFSRGRWRDIKDQERRSHDAKRKAAEHKESKARAAAEAAKAVAQAATAALRLAEDHDNAARLNLRLLQSAVDALDNARSLSETVQAVANLSAVARMGAAHHAQAQDDEDALILLMAA